jgi:hypothetical protein
LVDKTLRQTFGSRYPEYRSLRQLPTRICTGVALLAASFACGGTTETSPTVTPAATDREVVSNAPRGELPSCQPVLDACDANFTGTWQLRQCPLQLSGPIDLRGLGLGCAEGTTLSSNIEISGSLQLDAGGRLIDNTTTTGTHEFELPAHCFDVAVPATCADVARPLRGWGYETLVCEEQNSSGDCVCKGSFEQEGGLALLSTDPIHSADIVVDGQRLVASDDGSTVTYEYCAAEDVLVLNVTQPSRVGHVNGSVVFYRGEAP